MIFPGWILARTIPYETWIGLATGQYQLYGGVIRWAAGTAKAGQIVRHLVPVGTNLSSVLPGVGFIPGIIANIQLNEIKGITQFNTYQLMQIAGQVSSLSQVTQNLLQLATGTAILSGLGLAVSGISFVAINKKLNAIDSKLKEIQKDVKAIKYFLESTERAKLFAAINNLLKIESKFESEHRNFILLQSRNTLGEINMRYKELLLESKTLEIAMANEEYFALTALAHTRCTAELGMFDVAAQEAEELNLFWQTQAQRIAKQLLIGDYPERLLATDFAELISITEIIQWLDFVHGEQKGYGWIDELRIKFNETWYSKGWVADIGLGCKRGVGGGIEKEQKMIIPALRKLIARGGVIEGYVSQYKMQEEQKIRPSEFELKLRELPESSSIEGCFILEPANS